MVYVAVGRKPPQTKKKKDTVHQLKARQIPRMSSVSAAVLAGENGLLGGERGTVTSNL